jgi:hypothetical protein
MGDGFRRGVDRVETDRFGDDWRIDATFALYH